MSDFIESKTAVEDRRHSTILSSDEVIVNMALATSHADLYRYSLNAFSYAQLIIFTHLAQLGLLYGLQKMIFRSFFSYSCE